MVNCTNDHFRRNSVAHLGITSIGRIPCHLWHCATLGSRIFAPFIRSKKFCRARRCRLGLVRCRVEHCPDSSSLSGGRHSNVAQFAADLCFVGPNLAHASTAIDQQHSISRRIGGRACCRYSATQSGHPTWTHAGPNPNKALSFS